MAEPKPLFVLVPSPLVGPSSWAPVAHELLQRDWPAVVTADRMGAVGSEPTWRATVDGVLAVLDEVARDQGVVLAGHSRAGPLLPAIGRSLDRHVEAYILVDSRLPHGGLSPLGAIAEEDAAGAAERRARLQAGERYPAWTDADLRELVPDPERRGALVAELRPRGPEFWTEPLPVVRGWPDAPCGYLRFSDAYRSAAESAKRGGWLVRELPAGHFHQLVDPASVAEALIGILRDLRNAGSTVVHTS